MAEPMPPQNTCQQLVSGKLVDTTGVVVNVKANGFVEYRLPNAAIQVVQPRVREPLDPLPDICATWQTSTRRRTYRDSGRK
jgi:hypothetical protein